MLPPLSSNSRRKSFAAPASSASAAALDTIASAADAVAAQAKVDAAAADTAVRNLLLSSGPANSERLCYLYRHFATGGLTNLNVDQCVVALPYGDNRYSCSIFSKVGVAIPAAYLGRFADAVPAVWRPITDANVTKVGTWIANVADAGAFGGFYTRSLTAGDTIASDGGANKLVGHTLFASIFNISNAGFALVAIDGDYTAANMLPTVTQTEVTAGYFSSGDIGKRYLDTYLAVTDTDCQVCLAEGLTDTAHTITIKVQGTKRAASGDVRVYVTGFGAASALTKPTDANARLSYVRYVGDPRGGISSIACVPSYTPTGFTNYQFMGEAHGNDALVSEAWTADGVAGGSTNGMPAAGAYLSGQEIRLERVFTFNHPNAAACATRRHVCWVKVGDPFLHSENQVRWATAGSLSQFYTGMLPVGQLNPAGSPTFKQTNFDRIRVGDTLNLLPTLNTDALSPNIARADHFAVCSTSHDLVVVVATPRSDLATANWAYGGGSFFQDRSDGQDKVYLYRILNVLETINVGTVHAWETLFRVFRVPSAATALAA